MAEIAALRQSIQDEAIEEVSKSFVNTTAVQHLDWELAYLGDHLAAQIAKRRAELQADQLPADERSVRPPSPFTELQEVPHPPSECLPEQVIKGDQEPAIRAAESDESIEQIDNPKGVLDRQE